MAKSLTRSEEPLRRLDKNGRHLLGLINDVLDLSKIEAGSAGALAQRLFYEVRLCRASFPRVESLATEKKLALKVAVGADLPRGKGDDRRITQVLLNLAGNAIKFTEAGEVRIEATVSDNVFVVSVADFGARHCGGRAAKDFRGIPSGRKLQHPQKGRHGPWALDC